MFVFFLHLFSKSSYIQNELCMRPCTNLLEKIIAAFYKFIIECFVVTLDIIIYSIILSIVISKYIELRHNGLFLDAFAAIITFIPYVLPISKLIIFYRICKACVMNHITISGSPYYHLIMLCILIKLILPSC